MNWTHGGREVEPLDLIMYSLFGAFSVAAWMGVFRLGYFFITGE